MDNISTQEQKTLYFAYGSNMNPTQMGKRCHDFKEAGIAALQGYAFALDSEPRRTEYMGKILTVATFRQFPKDYLEVLRYFAGMAE